MKYEKPSDITVDRVTNDTFGNPRWAVHFLTFGESYEKALRKAKGLGGRKFHNKQYGGGIVFTDHGNKEQVQEMLFNYINQQPLI